MSEPVDAQTRLAAHVESILNGAAFRKRDRAEQLPSTREIDNALRAGLVMFMAKRGLRRPKDVVGHAILAPVFHFAIEELARRDFDTKSPTTVARFWRRLGIFAK